MAWNLSPTHDQTVLLPFDFSEPATAALATARGLVSSPEQLFVVHVIPPIETSSPGFLAGGAIDLVKLRERAGAELTKALDEAGLAEAQRRIRVGDPASEILAAARELGVALVVIPSRGKTGLRRWMIGSVAERVVRRARCPVLVLPIVDDDDDGDEEGEV